VDEHKTFTNAYTTGDMQRMALPCTLADDEEVLNKIRERYGNRRWMFIPNTLHLDKLYVSEDLAEELRRHPRCRIDPTPVPLRFQSGRLQLF